MIQVLRALSRFEGAEHLSEATVARMLVNGELRRRLALTDDRDHERELVRDELIAMHRRDRERIAEREDEVSRVRSDAAEETDRLREAAVSDAASLARAVAEAERARARERELAARLRDSEGRAIERATASARVVALEATIVGAFLAASGTVGVLLAVASVIVSQRSLDRGHHTVGAVACLLISWLWTLAGRRRVRRAPPEVRRHYRWLDPWPARVVAVASGTVTAIAAQLVASELFA
ncbi:MAG: hypothetical protein KY469_15855 [Actinobacteria bacterium]|nr:hypothetical protein [Actinomycetota bacterium]